MDDQQPTGGKAFDELLGKLAQVPHAEAIRREKLDQKRRAERRAERKAKKRKPKQ